MAKLPKNSSVYQKAKYIIDYHIEDENYVPNKENNEALLRKAIMNSGLFSEHQEKLAHYMYVKLSDMQKEQ